MMKKITRQRESEIDLSRTNLDSELSEERRRNQLLTDMTNLRQKEYFRLQLLSILERIAEALEGDSRDGTTD